MGDSSSSPWGWGAVSLSPCPVSKPWGLCPQPLPRRAGGLSAHGLCAPLWHSTGICSMLYDALGVCLPLCALTTTRASVSLGRSEGVTVGVPGAPRVPQSKRATRHRPGFPRASGLTQVGRKRTARVCVCPGPHSQPATCGHQHQPGAAWPWQSRDGSLGRGRGAAASTFPGLHPRGPHQGPPPPVLHTVLGCGAPVLGTGGLLAPGALPLAHGVANS